MAQKIPESNRLLSLILPRSYPFTLIACCLLAFTGQYDLKSVSRLIERFMLIMINEELFIVSHAMFIFGNNVFPVLKQISSITFGPSNCFSSSVYVWLALLCCHLPWSQNGSKWQTRHCSLVQAAHVVQLAWGLSSPPWWFIVADWMWWGPVTAHAVVCISVHEDKVLTEFKNVSSDVIFHLFLINCQTHSCL